MHLRQRSEKIADANGVAEIEGVDSDRVD